MADPTDDRRAADTTARERTLTMYQEITPLPVRPWTLNGLSERLIVSHYENNYGGAVRALNAVRSELAALEADAPGYRLRALKREELIAMGSVALHELYFGNLGGEGNKIPAQVRTMLRSTSGVSPHGAGTSWEPPSRSPAAPAGSCSRTRGDRSGCGTRSPRIIPRLRSTPPPSWRWICTSTRIIWTSGRTPPPTSTPSCGTSTGRPSPNG